MIPCRIGITENRLLITQNSKDVDFDCYDDTTKEPMRNKEPNSNMNSYIQNVVTYYTYASDRRGKMSLEERKKREGKSEHENRDEED
jgi:hypothetical protein